MEKRDLGLMAMPGMVKRVEHDIVVCGGGAKSCGDPAELSLV